MNRANQIILTVILFTMVSSVMTCVKNPVTGKRDFMLVSKKGEQRMGDGYDPQVVASFGLYEDNNLQRFIETKGQAMARISHRPELKYEFKVVDSPVVNAFAVPGGYVYFTRGIMAHFNNEAEFAGVLGHEIGHITARHSVKQHSKSIVAQLGLVVGMVVSPTFRQFGDLASQSLGLLFLKFGRDAESQSDELGVEYSSKIGYDAHEMAGFFQTLHRLSADSGHDVPSFLSTHPDPLDRNKKVDEMADEWARRKSNLKVNRDQYLRLIDGLVYGEDPRQGYVENNVFYHPEMKFQYKVPNNWRTNNSPQQVQHAPEDGKAVLILTLGKGSDLESAANAHVTENQLTVLNKRNTRVNGLSAIELLTEQVNQQDPNASLKILTYLIKDGNVIYELHGLSAKADYNRYSNNFKSTMESFKKLTDSSKINVKPAKIKIEKVKSNSTLSAALRSFNQDSKKFKELSILNGMELNDSVKKGMLIKTLTK